MQMHLSECESAFVYKNSLLISLCHLHKRFILIFIQVILGEFMIKFFLLHQSHHKRQINASVSDAVERPERLCF